jgi:cysteine rich protein 61
LFQKGRKCKNTWRQVKDIKFQYNGCTSVKEYRPKYCATCKRSRCCVPDKTKTNAMEWDCGGGKRVVHDFMWIKSCICTDDCPESEHHHNK